MTHKIRVRSHDLRGDGKPGKWMVWAAFASPIDAFDFAEALKAKRPHWDVQTYTGRGAFEYAN